MKLLDILSMLHYVRAYTITVIHNCKQNSHVQIGSLQFSSSISFNIYVGWYSSSPRKGIVFKLTINGGDIQPIILFISRLNSLCAYLLLGYQSFLNNCKSDVPYFLTNVDP